MSGSKRIRMHLAQHSLILRTSQSKNSSAKPHV
jgi:hypothetical protein